MVCAGNRGVADFPPSGIPAKNLYRKFVFVETESDLIGPHELPICKMTADLPTVAKGAGCVIKDFWSAIDMLISQTEIVIDRPKGTKHPRFDFIYPLDYGYLKDTTSPDGDGIDVWRGSLPESVCDAVICIVDLLKKDSEIKILIGCTEEEKAAIMRFHNDSEYMKGMMIRRGVR